MVNFLRKLFIKNYEDVKNQKVRESHGKLASWVGIFSNLFLFIVKIITGLLSASISIIADSINNLSDMASSIITLVGFKLAGAEADDEHPYGHERIEYIAGLIVAIIIMFVGGALFITSIEKIIDYKPEDINYLFTYISIGILTLSILVKIWQSLFNKKVAKLIDSLALEATASDSRNDVIATSGILLGTIVVLICSKCNTTIPFSIDGVLGIVVSLFIVFSGIMLIKDTMNPLIGNQVSREYVTELLQFIKSYDIVLGYHDTMCHMYGPTKCFMTIHIEVDSTLSIIDIHEAMDEIEKAVRDKFGVFLTIHMDPVELNNPELIEVRQILEHKLNEIDSELKYHDLRIVKKNSISTVLFDIVIPYKYKLTEQELTSILKSELNKLREYNLLIDYDHNFISKD